MEEYFFSGYCRRLDQSRTVAAEIEDGGLWVDCDYPSCPHQQSCPIGEKLRQLSE